MAFKTKYRIWHRGTILYGFVTTKRNLEDCIEIMKEMFKDYQGWFMCLCEGNTDIVVYDTRVYHRKALKENKIEVEVEKEEKPTEKELAGFFDYDNFFKKFIY